MQLKQGKIQPFERVILIGGEFSGNEAKVIDVDRHSEIVTATISIPPKVHVIFFPVSQFLFLR